MMKKITFKNLYFLPLVICLLSLVSVPAVAQTAGIRLEASAITSESELELRVLAEPSSPINAFDIDLQYPPEYLEFLRASTARSVVSVWQSLPLEARGGSIRLTGGMIKPLSASGELIALAFRVKKPGVAEFVITKGDFALADGKGTVVSAPEVRSQIALVQNGAEKFAQATLPAPKISEVAVTSDPIDKTAILSVKTEDDGAVEKLEVRSRKWIFWSGWRESRLTAAVPRDAWTVQVAVVGWDGGRDEITIYRWSIATAKLALVLAALAALGYLGKRLIIVWRIKRRKNL